VRCPADEPQEAHPSRYGKGGETNIPPPGLFGVGLALPPVGLLVDPFEQRGTGVLGADGRQPESVSNRRPLASSRPTRVPE
jgi:hypothetical protein